MTQLDGITWLSQIFCFSIVFFIIFIIFQQNFGPFFLFGHFFCFKKLINHSRSIIFNDFFIIFNYFSLFYCVSALIYNEKKNDEKKNEKPIK